MGLDADQVTYERRGAAAVVTIDRPERRNAVDGPTAELLGDAHRRFEDDDGAARGTERFTAGEGRGGEGAGA
ncbi:hypothetical protein BH20ACT19_BH20ACT19_12250 [soil metagenome]